MSKCVEREIEIQVIEDSGYGEVDCDLIATVEVCIESAVIYDTPLGSHVGEQIASVRIIDGTLFGVDQDGGNCGESPYERTNHDEAIKEEVYSLFQKGLL